jgi:putative endonuclease
MDYWVYILRCENDALYTGYTTDMERRLEEHAKGTDKSRFTRSFPPIRVEGCWRTDTLSRALKLENRIKSLNRREKLSVIADPSSVVEEIEGSVITVEQSWIGKPVRKGQDSQAL